MGDLFLQPQKKLKSSLFSKLSEAIAEAVETVADAGKALGEMVKSAFKSEQTKTPKNQVTVSPTIAVTENHQKTAEELDRELVLPALSLLGTETREKIVFLKSLHYLTGLSITDLTQGLKCLLGTGLSIDELLCLQIGDLNALLKIWSLRSITTSTPDIIYNSFPVIVVTCVERWMDQMVAVTSAALSSTVALAFPRTGTLEDALRCYVCLASEDIPIPNEWAFRLFRIAIQLAGGYMLPIDTIKMTALWGLMLGEMEDLAPEQESNLKEGVALLSMWISLTSHMVTEGISSAYGNVLKAISEKSSETLKNSFYALFRQIGADSMSAKKYLAWNKTTGVLIENETMTMSGAMRMMSTFTLGRTFMKSLTGKLEFFAFLKDLSPIPSRRTIHDILTLFRLPADYNRRVDIIYRKLEGLVREKPTDDDVRKAAACYLDLLKLKLAYIPFRDFGKDGGIIDPKDTFIDEALIDSISLHAFSRINRGLITGMRRRRFKNHLREHILSTQDRNYIEYFGEPRLPKRKESLRITYE